MKNPIEAIELCFKLEESTLKHISQELAENPFDRRALKVRDESLELLVPLIEEAEFVHKNNQVTNIGKAIYDIFAQQPKYNIKLQTDPQTDLGRKLNNMYTFLDSNPYIDPDVKRKCIESFEQVRKIVEG